MITIPCNKLSHLDWQHFTDVAFDADVVTYRLSFQLPLITHYVLVLSAEVGVRTEVVPTDRTGHVRRFRLGHLMIGPHLHTLDVNVVAATVSE